MRYILEIFRNIWKFFVSVKLTIVLLLSLAGTSIIGTLIPQNRSQGEYLEAFGEFRYRLFDVLNIFDMYHSWWFQLLVVLLAVNILVCSIDRLSATWKIIFPKKANFKLSRFKNRAGSQVVDDSRSPDQLKDVCEKVVSRKFGTVLVEQTDQGFAVFGERWRWTRLGVYIVHASVIILLVGGLLGSIFGFDGYVNIPEGETVDHIRLRNSDQVVPLGFGIRCNDFSVSFYPTGQPKEFRSSLSLVKDGQAVYDKDIIVNDPIRYQGINIFQASYGELGPATPASAAAAPKEITLSFTSTGTEMAYEETVTMGQKVALPEDAGTFVLEDYSPAATFMGQEIGAALKGTLTPADGEPVEVLLPLRFPNFDKMRRGAIVISVSGQKAEKFVPGAAKAAEKRYYTGLEVTKDPGVWFVYTGFVLMIIGCFITFFMSHQQLCIEVVGRGKGSRATVSGTANRNRLAMDTRVKIISESIAHKD